MPRDAAALRTPLDTRKHCLGPDGGERHTVEPLSELGGEVGCAEAAAGHELGGVVAYAGDHGSEGRREHLVHEILELIIGVDGGTDSAKVDGGTLRASLAAGGRRLARRRAEAGGLEAGAEAECAINGALRVGRRLLEPGARPRPECRADV